MKSNQGSGIKVEMIGGMTGGLVGGGLVAGGFVGGGFVAGGFVGGGLVDTGDGGAADVACSPGRFIVVGEMNMGEGDAVGVVDGGTVGEKLRVEVAEGVDVIMAVGELVAVWNSVAVASNLGDRSMLNMDVAAPNPVFGITKSGS